jgi:hypothetical protein
VEKLQSVKYSFVAIIENQAELSRLEYKIIISNHDEPGTRFFPS